MSNLKIRMGEKLQIFNNLDPPPKNTTVVNNNNPQSPSNTTLQIEPKSDLEEAGSNRKTLGMHPNVLVPSTSNQNFAIGPPPINSKYPKTLGVVSSTTDLIGNESTNPKEPKMNFSITPNP